MKKVLIVFVGIGLIVVSQMAFSIDAESFQKRCEKQAEEDNVDQAIYEEYMSDCIRYYQDSDLELEIDSQGLEEGAVEESSIRE